MTKSWVIFIFGAAGLVAIGLYVYRRLNPAPNEQKKIYVAESDKSKVEVGPAKVRTLGEKKTWDDVANFLDYDAGVQAGLNK